MNISGLIGAVRAAELGSFSAAARLLNLTPAAVSKNVALLEQQLGVRLFNRSTRRLALTEEGRAFVAQAGQGLQLLQEAGAQAKSFGAPQGLVRVTSAVGFGRTYLLPLLPAFLAAQPQVQVELVLDDHPVDLVQGGFDLGLRGGSQPPEGMVARRIAKLAAVLVASPAYLKRAGTPRHWRELAQHELIRVRFLNGKADSWVFREDGRLHRLDATPRLWLSDPELAGQAALAGLGIARASRHHVADALREGRLVSLLPQQTDPGDATLSLFYPHRSGQAPRVRVLVDHLLAAWAKDPRLGASPVTR